MKRILTSPWFLGFVLTIPVLMLLNPVFKRYRIILDYSETNDKNILHIYYRDLNGDGKSEKIKSCLSSNNQFSFQIFDPPSVLLTQMNFPHSFSSNTQYLYFGDQDMDGYNEVYGFTMSSDSLFLVWFEPYPDFSGKWHERFISSVGKYNQGSFDFHVVDFFINDPDQDNAKEIIFSIEAGYSMTPRRIFRYWPETDSLIMSKDRGINAYDLTFSDLDSDGKKEIITSSSVSGNLKNSCHQDTIDDRPWLQVFTSGLEPFFQPVPFPKGPVNEIKTFVTGDSVKPIILFHLFKGSPDHIPVKIFLLTKKGLKIDSLFIKNEEEIYITNIIQDPTGYYVLSLNRKVTIITPGLKVVRSFDLEVLPVSFEPVIKPGRDPVKYIANSFDGNALHLFDNRFNLLGTIENGNPIRSVETIASPAHTTIVLHAGKTEYHYHISGNRLYLLKYPIYLLVFLIMTRILRIFQVYTEKRLGEKYALQEQIRELQIRSINNQMDPHFMFNLFTIIASLLKKGQGDEAFQAFLQFSKLVRSNLENEGRITRTLKEELEITGNWLDLSRMRFGEKISFKLEVEEGIDDQLLVPRMFLQIHAENSVKHGLLPKAGNGHLLIGITRSGGFMDVVVEDDGAGRKASAESGTQSTQKGHRMLQTIYDRLNETNYNKVTQKMIDLYDLAGEAAGTRVEIRVPVDLREPGISMEALVAGSKAGFLNSPKSRS